MALARSFPPALRAPNRRQNHIRKAASRPPGSRPRPTALSLRPGPHLAPMPLRVGRPAHSSSAHSGSDADGCPSNPCSLVAPYAALAADIRVTLFQEHFFLSLIHISEPTRQ